LTASKVVRIILTAPFTFDISKRRSRLEVIFGIEAEIQNLWAEIQLIDWAISRIWPMVFDPRKRSTAIRVIADLRREKEAIRQKIRHLRRDQFQARF